MKNHDLTPYRSHPLFERYYSKLPEEFHRTELEEYLPGVIASGTLGNRIASRKKALREGRLEEAEKLAPPTFRKGRKDQLERDSFLWWLFSYWVEALE